MNLYKFLFVTLALLPSVFASFPFSTKGSVGPDCCGKKCVNVMIDGLNCGFCGKKCKYQEICCKGLCVNPLSDEKNCGKCNNKCESRSSCVYGMCSYA
ncbi:hypothetical protein CDL12_29353 [Handroanthus impetiginosus]|uniref:Stigma-specific protein Stig1 n=1 Tax=Handroanthus impetiginosus TaxID=429701 RepID=A0A2G9FZ08_9LAMI|nr:hypothetical protein CDL12_29353 [Handroanthus impetiginosus]